jgi:CTP-dependent riboflavin kinase
VIKGRIFSGMGEGAFFTCLEWVNRQCQEKLNFIPFPGTLNLRVEDEYLDIVIKLKEKEGILLMSPTPEFCHAKCFPVFIGSVRGAIIVPQAEHFTNEVHPPEVIEIIAPVNIKETLSVKDEDEIIIEVEEQ